MKQLFTLLFLLPLAAFGQRIQSDYTDDFGCARRIATSRIALDGAAGSMSGTINIRNHDTLLRMNIIFRAGQATYTNEHTTALLQLNNGETIEVVHMGGYKELSATEPGFLVFAVTEAMKSKLMACAVTEYTIHTGNIAVRISLNEYQQVAFRNTLALLQEQARSTASLD